MTEDDEQLTNEERERAMAEILGKMTPGTFTGFLAAMQELLLLGSRLGFDFRGYDVASRPGAMRVVCNRCSWNRPYDTDGADTVALAERALTDIVDHEEAVHQG